MQIEIDKSLMTCGDIIHTFCYQSLVELSYDLFCSKNCWLQLWIWIFIVPIEVLVECIISEVTSVNAIRIQARNDLEYEVIPKPFGRLIFSKWKIWFKVIMTYSNSKNLMRPFRTCEDGTSPGCTLADKKTTGLLKIQERVLPPSPLLPRSGCKIGCSRYFSY